jgi:hypothetical protein
MKMTRRALLSMAGLTSAWALGCNARPHEEQPQDDTDKDDEGQQEAKPSVDLDEFESLALDMNAWSFDEQTGCYYQLSVPYCLHPSNELYESLSIYVPARYFVAERRGRHYACEIDANATVGDFTATTAPTLMPLNTPLCTAQECPGSFAPEGLSRYLDAGIVYVYPGLRGRSGGYESTTQEYYAGGAPWPAVDLKAAIRFLRYNRAVLPGDTDRIFLAGWGAGADMAAIAGTSGASSAFEPYLGEIGAATHDAEGNDVSDAPFGLALWNPVGSFSSADAAYEWMMGRYAQEGTRAAGTWTKRLSDDLAADYGPYVNGLGLTTDDGEGLRLERIDDGTYAGGSYYDHLVGVVADAAAEFFHETSFPYMRAAMDAGTVFPGDPSLSGTHALLDAQAATTADDEESGASEARDTGVRQVKATVFETRESYVSTLNGDGRWLTYNADAGTVDVTGLWGFVGACRPADHDVCAYDRIDRSGMVNQLFGTDQESSLHFDSMVARLVDERHARYAKLEGWNEDYVSEWRGDLAETDAQDMTVELRVALSDPLALLERADGQEEPATVAPYWRINTGLFQAQTTLVGELNLARALAGRDDVARVDFQAVWEAGFSPCERTGEPQDKLVAWIRGCCKKAGAAKKGKKAKASS